MKASEVVNLAASQVGYKEKKGNITKYGEFFDTRPPKGAWQFFNGKKNGVDWCSIFVHWLLCKCECGESTTISQLEKIRKNMGEPADGSKNCAAGVLYFWRYLDYKNREIRKKDGQPGDIIFFNTSKKPGHVGIIERVTSTRYYTIEGNASNMVKRKSYLKSSSKIYGIARYPYDEE